jgi:hypothetical protein
VILYTVSRIFGLTGSSNVSQKILSITVTTRPGFSGVPRWSVLLFALVDVLIAWFTGIERPTMTINIPSLNSMIKESYC